MAQIYSHTHPIEGWAAVSIPPLQTERSLLQLFILDNTRWAGGDETDFITKTLTDISTCECASARSSSLTSDVMVVLRSLHFSIPLQLCFYTCLSHNPTIRLSTRWDTPTRRRAQRGNINTSGPTLPSPGHNESLLSIWGGGLVEKGSNYIIVREAIKTHQNRHNEAKKRKVTVAFTELRLQVTIRLQLLCAIIARAVGLY